MNSKPPKLIVVVGETASGKSALAMDIASRYSGEIICADSWTVRREVNIGTAKPSQSDRTIIPHHLLDIAGPDEDFTAAVFKRLALRAIDEISTRGKLPIMVGGTGLYIDGVIFDYNFLPAGDRGQREQLNDLSNEELIVKIADLNIELGEIDTGNKRRLIRLIETNGAKPTKQEMRQNTLIIGTKIDREVLEHNITNRVDSMIETGLEAEVRQLVNDYGWGCEALKGIGYAQWQNYINGTESIEEVRKNIIKATADLAKRQRTWFKRNKSIQWLATPVKQTNSDEIVTTFLNS